MRQQFQDKKKNERRSIIKRLPFFYKGEIMSEINQRTSSSKLGIFGLAAIVVSSMIGGGIFSLPQNMAQNAAVGSVI